MEETIKFIGKVAKIINNGKTLVFREDNFWRCECEKGEIVKGDGTLGCKAKLKLFKTNGDRKFYSCSKSELIIIVLKISEKEMKKFCAINPKLKTFISRYLNK